MRRIASGARPDCLATIKHLKSCAPQALSPLQAADLVPSLHRRAEKEMQELSPSRRGTAVPGLQQLPLPDSLMTSSSVDGLSELVRAPDSPPTGKTLETVKERVCFTASGKRVKKTITILCDLFSTECSSSTGACSKSGAGRRKRSFKNAVMISNGDSTTSRKAAWILGEHELLPFFTRAR